MFKFQNILKNNYPYIIAEIGVNHEGSLILAKKMMRLAKSSGANCVKFQTYKAEKLASKNSPYYWDLKKEKTRSQYDLFKKYDSFELDDYKKLYEYSKIIKIDFLTTPFDTEVVDDIDRLIKFYKISSSDLNNFPLIKKICEKNKPIVLSTGASTLDEIKKTVNYIYKLNPNLQIALLHCVLSYPTKNIDANLNFIPKLKEIFPNCIIGYSDHTLPNKDMDVLLYSYILGANIIEKHFTYDKSKKGNDHYHAMDYKDLKNFFKSLNNYKILNGSEKKFRKVLNCEKKSRLNARRNIYTNKDLKKGEYLTEDSIICKRPAVGGIDPKFFNKILGKKLNRQLKNDRVIKYKYLVND